MNTEDLVKAKARISACQEWAANVLASDDTPPGSAMHWVALDMAAAAKVAAAACEWVIRTEAVAAFDGSGVQDYAQERTLTDAESRAGVALQAAVSSVLGGVR